MCGRSEKVQFTWRIGEKRKQPFLSGVDHIVDKLVRRLIR
ncbi:hypothetical protein SGL43_06079 [Streptomyces globisporus]|uniref:Transposase n=1 Tax=Streptomyces globisporus TaxID=1908 RepID=A0ABN8VD92_STRGL|nr:hypothetical protein SGL43_06079 [Streptomyces globisporus]